MKRFAYIALCLLALASCQKPLEITRTQLKDKIAGAWLGQMVGNIYGLEYENKFVDEPGEGPFVFNKAIRKMTDVDGAFSDDDTDVEYLYLLMMEKNGVDPTYAQVKESWMYHIRDRVWLANRAALGLMHYGFTPPLTGDKRYNPHWFQIDPQLFGQSRFGFLSNASIHNDSGLGVVTIDGQIGTQQLKCRGQLLPCERVGTYIVHESSGHAQTWVCFQTTIISHGEFEKVVDRILHGVEHGLTTQWDGCDITLEVHQSWLYVLHGQRGQSFGIFRLCGFVFRHHRSVTRLRHLVFLNTAIFFLETHKWRSIVFLGGSHDVGSCHLVDGIHLFDILLPTMSTAHHHDHLGETAVDFLQFY